MVYKQSTLFTCGPSSYINFKGLRGSKKEELRLRDKGRIWPTRIFYGVSFLEIDKNFSLYIKNRRISKEAIKKYGIGNDFLSYYNSLINKHKSRIHRISSISKVIDFLKMADRKRRRILLLTHSSTYLPDYTGSHWICFYKIEKNKYVFAEPYRGIKMYFTEKQVRKTLEMLEKVQISIQFLY